MKLRAAQKSNARMINLGNSRGKNGSDENDLWQRCPREVSYGAVAKDATVEARKSLVTHVSPWYSRSKARTYPGKSAANKLL
uniref:Uncharacterized protein n=1 Tax=Ascaris lumbricoides TaxID=6252 RepID=A0A0M3HWC2_ASCLU